MGNFKLWIFAACVFAYTFIGQHMNLWGDKPFRLMGMLMVFAGGLFIGILIAHPHGRLYDDRGGG